MNKRNPHTRLASFYRYFYLTTELPNNLCAYVWSLLLAFILTPFVWIAIFDNYRNKRIYWYVRNESWTEYDEKNKPYKVTNTLKYYNKQYSTVPTAMGILATVMVFIIGLVSLVILISCFGVPIKPNTLTWLQNTGLLYGLGLLTSLLAIAIGIGFIALVRLISALIPKKPEETQQEYEARIELCSKKYLEEQRKREERENNPNFLRLLWRWFVAIKEKNCPIINWDYDKEKK